MKPQPAVVPEELKSFTRKDYVTYIDEEGTLQVKSLSAYNKFYFTHVTLEDVYGKDYVDALTQQEISEFETPLFLYANGDGYLPEPRKSWLAYFESDNLKSSTGYQPKLFGVDGFETNRKLFDEIHETTWDAGGTAHDMVHLKPLKLFNNPNYDEEINENAVSYAMNEFVDRDIESNAQDEIEYSPELVCHVFDDAIKLGNKNAQINLFTYLWFNLKRYKEALKHLQTVNATLYPSYQTLWNEALIFSDIDIPDNPFQRDEAHSYSIMRRIIKDFAGHPSRIDIKALSFMEHHGFNYDQLKAELQTAEIPAWKQEKVKKEIPIFKLRGLNCFLCERDIYDLEGNVSSVLSSNPDRGEALNEQGIIAANEGNNVDKAAKYFQKAIDKGNKNASQNIIVHLWTNQRFKELEDYLNGINYLDNTLSPDMLWNIAVLFCGLYSESPYYPMPLRCKNCLNDIVAKYSTHSTDLYNDTLQLMDSLGYQRPAISPEGSPF